MTPMGKEKAGETPGQKECTKIGKLDGHTSTSTLPIG